MNELISLIRNELHSRSWSMSELARRSGVSIALMSDVLNEKQPASSEFCIKLAQALDISAEDALRLAKHLPQLPVAVSDEREALSLLRRLDTQIRHSIITTMRSLLGLQTLSTVSDPPARYESAPRTLSERMAYQLLAELENMHPDDIQRVLEFMDKLKGERNGNGKPNEASMESI